MEDIIECDFNLFKIVLFEVKWNMPGLNGCDYERTIIDHVNGFTMVNTREIEPST